MDKRCLSLFNQAFNKKNTSTPPLFGRMKLTKSYTKPKRKGDRDVNFIIPRALGNYQYTTTIY
ncbi:hypothetical protein, partial [Tetragenococcus koreensis]|uniref:hypothetical protein n=1 Tax=Tetragenococcus koreensis TaxID=290335 RepID=UPI001F34BFE1